MAKKSHSVNQLRPGFFRFRDLGGKYLLTNDAGEHIILDPPDFQALSQGALDHAHPSAPEMKSMGILLDEGGMPARLVEKFMKKKSFVFNGPMLFIAVVTLRCNMSCAYCHAGAHGVKAKELDMSLETARKVVDTIFDSPGAGYSIEFQGGEPLLNWDAVKYIADYSLEKNKEAGKSLFITLVSNLTLLDKEKEDYLLGNRVGICTSLDGPEFLHNKNRGGGYRATAKKLKALLRRCRIEFDRYLPAALTTITRHSLPYHKEIVDTFAAFGLEAIHLRQLNPVGFAAPILKEIGYSPQEFIEFYAKALDYILELNKKGTKLVERTAWLFLSKIFNEYDPGFLDLRSPCGAGIGQIAFNHNGNVYTCDEGRMLSMQGDESFKMGNVFENTYNELIGAEIVKLTCLHSTLDGIPHCHNCAYLPYCGVCPLLNYLEEGSLFPRIPENRRHIINQGILDIIFTKLQDESDRAVFMDWLAKGIIVS